MTSNVACADEFGEMETADRPVVISETQTTLTLLLIPALCKKTKVPSITTVFLFFFSIVFRTLILGIFSRRTRTRGAQKIFWRLQTQNIIIGCCDGPVVGFVPVASMILRSKTRRFSCKSNIWNIKTKVCLGTLFHATYWHLPHTITTGRH